MKLSTRSRYAVMAMADLAIRPSHAPVSLPEIALRQGLPLPYLEQLFVPLRRKGFVKSLHGHRGGYLLGSPPEAISLAAIVQAMGEKLKITRCRGGKGKQQEGGGGCLPNGARCMAHHAWEQMEQAIIESLEKISLADVCGGRLPEVLLDSMDGSQEGGKQP